MKTIFKSSLFATAILLFFFLGTSSLFAYQGAAVYAQNEDISYDLDLNAVASIFGQSRDLADFEWRLNDPNLQISNLDLNGDYRVDYLRVIETTQYGMHLIVIQAVVGPDMYQDVATIEVSRNGYDNTYVQIVGDPYLYGYNYIIEPYYAYTPVIYSYFWSTRYYRPYYSHYRWGYYPRYYRPWRPMPVHYYRKHVHRYIDRRHRYHYTTVRRNTHARVLHKQVRRNDYARRYPNRSYVNRQHRGVKRNANRKVYGRQAPKGNRQLHQGGNRHMNGQRSQSRNHQYKGGYQNTTRHMSQRKAQSKIGRHNNHSRVSHQQQRAGSRDNATNRHKSGNRQASRSHQTRQSHQKVYRYQNRKSIQARSHSGGKSVRHGGSESRRHNAYQTRSRQTASAQKHTTARSHTASGSHYSGNRGARSREGH